MGGRHSPSRSAVSLCYRFSVRYPPSCLARVDATIGGRSSSISLEQFQMRSRFFHKVACYGFWIVISSCGVIIAARMLLGPFSFFVRVDSPMNVEAALAVTLVLSLVARTGSLTNDIGGRRFCAHPPAENVRISN